MIEFVFYLILLVNNGSIIILWELGIEGQYILIESFVEHIKLRRCGALYIEPPIAGQGNLWGREKGVKVFYILILYSAAFNLTKDGAIGAQKGGLSAVKVAVVPHLAIGLGITKETFITLLRALEACLGYFRIVGIVYASTSGGGTRMLV